MTALRLPSHPVLFSSENSVDKPHKKPSRLIRLQTSGYLGAGICSPLLLYHIPVSVNITGHRLRQCEVDDQWVWENLTSSGLSVNCAYWTDLLGVLISFHLSFAPVVRLSKKSIKIIACTSTCLLKVKSLIYGSCKPYLSVTSHGIEK